MGTCQNRRVGRLIRWIGVGVVLLAGITWYALEGRDVATLRTAREADAVRETHVWVVEEGDSMWVEAATPERAWLLDIEANPFVQIERAGETRRFRAAAAPGPEARDRLRTALREKYGWADAWVGLFQDTSQAVAVRLDPLR